jgi:hypothetical protein
MTCTACERSGSPDCTATFRCHVCGRVFNICAGMVGGFGGREPICTECHYRRETGRDLVSRHANKRAFRPGEAWG